jgi:hypothetical protein
MAGHGWAWLGGAGLGPAWQGKARGRYDHTEGMILKNARTDIGVARARQGGAGQGRAGRGGAGQGRAGRGGAWPGWARHGKARQGQARGRYDHTQGMILKNARTMSAGPGLAQAPHGKAGLGEAGRGMARPGTARHGLAWRGLAGPGEARGRYDHTESGGGDT